MKKKLYRKFIFSVHIFNSYGLTVCSPSEGGGGCAKFQNMMKQGFHLFQNMQKGCQKFVFVHKTISILTHFIFHCFCHCIFLVVYIKGSHNERHLITLGKLETSQDGVSGVMAGMTTSGSLGGLRAASCICLRTHVFRSGSTICAK